MSAPRRFGPSSARSKGSPPLLFDLVKISSIVVFRGEVHTYPGGRKKILSTRDGLHYVSFRGSNGRNLSTSQGYADQRSAWNLAFGVQRQLRGLVTVRCGFGIKEVPPAYRVLLKGRWAK